MSSQDACTAEQRLRRTALLEATAAVAQQLAERPDWRGCIADVLARVGQAAGVSRAYLFHGQAGRTVVVARWKAAESKASRRAGTGAKSRPAKPFARWNHLLGAGRIIQGGPADFPPDEKKALLERGVQSVLQVPINVGGEWWGFVGLDDRVSRRDWSEGEIQILRILASLLGIAMQRNVAGVAERDNNARDRRDEAPHLAQIRELTVESARSVERERSRISRELHDELGQWLTAINLNVAWLASRADAWEAPAKERLLELPQLVNQMLEAVRNLSTRLRPPILDNRGLLEAIRSYAVQFARRANISFRVTASPPDLEVPDPLATPAFRIIQEALTNIARHSRASKCGIFLKLTDRHLELKVRDNGVGAVPTRLAGVQSLGIAGMRERAAAVGGTLKIENRPEGGVCVAARFPWPRKNGTEE
jgi:signal transduction histidine kinase